MISDIPSCTLESIPPQSNHHPDLMIFAKLFFHLRCTNESVQRSYKFSPSNKTSLHIICIRVRNFYLYTYLDYNCDV